MEEVDGTQGARASREIDDGAVLSESSIESSKRTTPGS